MILLPAITTGFLTGFALILAIGAQNAFVLRQGILRNHIFWVALICALSDAILIIAGVAGFDAAILAFPSLPLIMSLAGALFLIIYGAQKFWAAYRGGENQGLNGTNTALLSTLLTCLALTWLNPHVYLDTLGLIGAISTQYSGVSEKMAFASGATLASFVFFFSLGYGARLLAPIMQTARTWQILDVLIGMLMWYLAYGLLRSI